MNADIIQFLRQQTCATICLVDGKGHPYCFNCFYRFNAERGVLYFKSSAGSFHGGLLLPAPVVAGTVLPDKLDALSPAGVQFQGRVLEEGAALTERSSWLYHRRHPLALTMPGVVWTVRVDTLKMTLGIGKKLTWQRDVNEVADGGG